MCVVASATALHFKSHNNELKFAEFAGEDKDLLVPEDKEDEPPVIYNANVMQAKTLFGDFKNHGRGKFKTAFQTENGIQVRQVGKLKDSKTFVVKGSYAYTGPDGKRYRVRYTADEFGYHPITELDVEIPEIEGPQVAVKPLTPLKPLKLVSRPLIRNDNPPPVSNFVPPSSDYLPPNTDYLPPAQQLQQQQRLEQLPQQEFQQLPQPVFQNVIRPVEDRRYLPPPPPQPSRAYLPVN